MRALKIHKTLHGTEIVLIKNLLNKQYSVHEVTKKGTRFQLFSGKKSLAIKYFTYVTKDL